MEDWLRAYAPWLSHFHLHNNRGSVDTHSHLAEGTIDMASLLGEALALCPAASFTLETTQARADLEWLQAQGLVE